MSEKLIFKCDLPNETATKFSAKRFWEFLKTQKNHNVIIYLKGNLGTGKTTFVRYFLQALGYKDFVKSPTFTLVESYTHGSQIINHFDLYRLIDPEELEYIGIKDYLENSLNFFEWPEKGAGYLKPADYVIELQNSKGMRTIRIEKL